MYKLTVIAGPNRGTSYALQEGSLTIGRQTGNSVVLQSSKVSKQHCAIEVHGDEVILKDLGSSNGTFVNGLLTKLKKLKTGDRISVGEFVLEMIEPVKRPSGKIAPAFADLGSPLQFQDVKSSMETGSGLSGQFTNPLANQVPKDLKGRALWYFESYVMPIFYGMNLKSEWRMIALGMFALFGVGNLLISVYPLLESGRGTVVKETGRRARYMARQIADQNSGFLAARTETKADLGNIESAEGVRVALLVDLDNRIIAPGTKLNQYLASGPEALVAVNARNRFRAGEETGFTSVPDDSIIVAVEPVKIMSPTAGKNVVVAMALVSLDTSLATPDLGEMGMIYSETLILTGILGGLILLILYRLTLKPLQVLNEEMDKALKGDLVQVTHSFKFEELDALWDIINSAIQRIPRADSTPGSLSGGSMEVNPDEYLSPLRVLGNLVKFGLVIFDSSQKIIYLNSPFEELSGIRSEGAMGQEMVAVARDQSMGAFTSDVLSRAAAGSEGVVEDYDFSGISHKVHVAAFGIPGNTPRCYVYAVVRVEA